ncbi:hypothetical protein [endosymbiont GvMRE of Glomus versiforme]|uniref:hypothetical protein n=1 Tax=endosymbiont GvMRE of Glomus versiforme TaxID=2039283 RepID=UPI000EDC721A|nr:hypothetical protein [endosymbiont GvMRE of Glomus versiforme]RHZ37017.1 hypothetical protein GvMRE_I2g88 [endosymbiont GvMRE of Glomus versiforme]
MNNPKTNRILSEIIKANLTEEQIKQNLGNLVTQQEQTIEPILKVEDKQKIEAYDKLETAGLPEKGLPTDWKKQLGRIEQLEINQADYNQKKEELKGWTDTFVSNSPQEIDEKIVKLEQRPDILQATWDDYKDRKSVGEYNDLEQELKTWKDTFKNQTAEEVEEKRLELVKKEEILKEWEQEFPQLTALQVKKNIEKLEQTLDEWMGTWNHRKLSEVKEEWELLKKRPDIPITQQQWWNDYTRRQSLTQSQTEREELEEEKKKVAKLQTENKKLIQDIDEIVENGRTIRYKLAEPVANKSQAKAAIENLLEKVEKEWEDYLKNGISDENPLLNSSCRDDKSKDQARKIVGWVKDARKSHDYLKLLEEWSQGKKYNKQHDYDGSLFLLDNYLKKHNA